VTELTTRVGPATNTGGTGTPPQIQITSPSDGATVPPGFNVDVTATDDGSISKVELYIDGNLSDTKTAAPYSFATDGSLAAGQHQIQTVAYDNAGNSTPTSINVTVQPGAPNPDPNPNPGNGAQNPSDLVGGCSTGGSSAGSLFLALALGGLVIRRRK
jgi:uncharacterized protein (TIGR03382 family)